VDDNCNGQIDEDGASGCTQVWRDADGDSYGDANQPSCRCQAAGGWVANALDCDDSRSASRPGAPELCNGLDDNCNSVVDDPDAQGCTTWLKDADADGAGVPTLTQCLCAPVAPYTATAGTAADCDDANPDVRPGKTEVCNDVDDNCDGMTDPAGTTGCVNYWEDADADTYGKNTDLPQCLCRSAGTRTATRSGDCNDANANVNPGKSEVCANGLDDNCSGGQDEGC
jgi:hypothetical protein